MILKSQFGVKLGETKILYVDEEKEFLQRVVSDPRLQQRLFSEWACKLGGKSETKSGETKNSGNHGKLIL